MNSSANSILVVEDDEDDLFAFKRAMKKAGITLPLYTVSNGQEAIDYLSGAGSFADRSRFPLPSQIFLDLKIPLVNGFSVLTWIRQSAHFADLHVVVLSGSDEVSDHERATQLGARAYLVKPASPAHLAEAIERIKA